MARIRTVKPGFFRHEGLYESEKETGLPLRLAFAGLWTSADREGRFIWSPRNLKLDALPYDDDVDFARVLDALWARGSIEKYIVDGKEYGFIPSWKEHQVINNREQASTLPEPNETNVLTRNARESHASVTPLKLVQVEGKGKEGKGTDKGTRHPRGFIEASFEEFWKAYPRRQGANPKKPSLEAFERAVKAGASPETIVAGAKRCAESDRDKVGTPYIPQAVKWLRDERWRDYPQNGFDEPVSQERQEEVWRSLLERMETSGTWPSVRIPAPGTADCPIPREFIDDWKANRESNLFKQGAEG